MPEIDLCLPWHVVQSRRGKVAIVDASGGRVLTLGRDERDLAIAWAIIDVANRGALKR